MTYYDHATAIAFKLGRWGEARPLRTFELEALASEQLADTAIREKPSLARRCVSVFRSCNPLDTADTPEVLEQ